MSVAAALGLGEHELVAFVGAGGKTSLLLGLGRELYETGRSVVLGTTTRMGTDQIPSWATVGETFIVGGIEGPKIIGSPPELFDELFETRDYVLVEADGARRKLIKAPAPHEPVIPDQTTTTVVVAGLDALGQPMGEVAHRPQLVSSITGLGPEEKVTAAALVALLSSSRGGLARVSASSRVVVALTGGALPEANGVQEQLMSHERISLVTNLEL